MGCEFLPAVEVAVPVFSMVNAPRAVMAPFTSRVEDGVLVSMPILVPDSKRMESSIVVAPE